MSEIKVTKDNFENVLNTDLPVLLDFWASWCGPCMMLGPIISEIAEEYKGKIVVGKVNVDEENELASAFRVTSIPMIALLKDKKLINTKVGYMPKEEILSMLE